MRHETSARSLKAALIDEAIERQRYEALFKYSRELECRNRELGCIAAIVRGSAKQAQDDQHAKPTMAGMQHAHSARKPD